MSLYDDILYTDEYYYMEEDDIDIDYVDMPTKASGGNFIQRTLKRIGDFFARLWNKFMEFITRKKIKTKLEESEDIIDENPSLNVKVQVPDIEGIEELTEKTLDAIEDAQTEEQVEVIMTRYQKLKAKLKNRGRRIAISIRVMIGKCRVLLGKQKGKLSKFKAAISNMVAKTKAKFSKKKSNQYDVDIEDEVSEVEDLIEAKVSAATELSKDTTVDVAEFLNNAEVTVEEQVISNNIDY